MYWLVILLKNCYLFGKDCIIVVFLIVNGCVLFGWYCLVCFICGVVKIVKLDLLKLSFCKILVLLFFIY